MFIGKIWTDRLGVPKQISLKAAGNESSLKYEKSYLRDRDSYFGYENFNKSYHITSDGNIRGFTNYDNMDADAILKTGYQSSDGSAFAGFVMNAEPAFFNPRDKPPGPENVSIAFITVLPYRPYLNTIHKDPLDSVL